MKITYLVPRHQYIRKMSRVRFHQIRAIEKITDLKWSGPGWGNYDMNRNVHDNLLSLWDGQLPDLVAVFDHRPLIGLQDTSVPRVTMMNEMHDPDGTRLNAFKLMRDNHYDHIVCHHENEMNDPYFATLRDRFVHLPHCADSSIFKDYGHDKTIDVLLCGNIKFEKYVLRRRFVGIIERLARMGFRAQIHKHPGGFHDDAHTDRYLLEFAEAINRAKICLTCSSIHKCAFSKYAEIPMCRSLLAGDIPGERQDFFRSFMLPIADEDTDDEIIKKITTQLDDKNALTTKTDLGYTATHANYTMDHYAKRFVGAADKFLRRRRILL